MSGLDDERHNWTEMQKAVAAVLRDYKLAANVKAVRSSPYYEADYDEPELRRRAENAQVDWEQAKAVVDTLWPLITGALAAVSADRDREAERADKAEALLTELALAEGDYEGWYRAVDAIRDWYTDAAMKAGQQ